MLGDSFAEVDRAKNEFGVKRDLSRFRELEMCEQIMDFRSKSAALVVGEDDPRALFAEQALNRVRVKA